MTLAQMPSKNDWLMIPVLNGMCRYESLLDGTLTLMDIAEMNDALLVRAENTKRMSRG